MRDRHNFRLVASILLLTGYALECRGQKLNACHIEYADQNQVDYGSQRRVGVVGIVTDANGTPVTGACVAIFTEKGHDFVAGVATRSNGKFQLPSMLRDGAYRVVVKVDGFGIANMKFEKVPETRADSVLHVHMLPAGIDTTSYIDSK